jgi:stage V sporulation protein B
MGAANSVLIPRQLVRGGMDSSAALSAFGVLCGMTLPMLSLPTGLIGALGLTMTPGLARQAALGRWEEIRKTLDRVVRLVSLLMAPAMALLTVVGPDLGKLLFKNGQVGEFIIPLAVGTLLGCWQAVFAGALNGMGKQREAARTAILCDGIQLAFTVCTVPRFGLGGFVVGSLITSLLGGVCDLCALCRTANLRPDWGAWFLTPVLAALLTGMWGNLLFRILIDNGVGHGISCLAVALLGTVLYLAAIQAQGFKKKSSVC